MSERKAVNKYYPPEWTPQDGSINKFKGQHPLRERARKLDQGILIVRFELPFNIWCGGCGCHVGMGKRYNAEKKKVGMYYSTPILSFRMKCHECPHWFEIQTDPKNTRYVVTSGAKQKDETWDPQSIGAEKIQSEEEKTRLKNDPLYKLERGHDDKILGKSMVQTNAQVKSANDATYGDSFAIDKLLRDKFRAERHKLEAVSDEKKLTQDRLNMTIELVPLSQSDLMQARSLDFQTRELVRTQQRKRQRLKSQSMLPATELSKTKHSRAVAQGMKARRLTTAATVNFGHSKSSSNISVPTSRAMAMLAKSVVTVGARACSASDAVCEKNEDTKLNKPNSNIMSDSNQTRMSKTTGLSLLGEYSSSDDSAG